MNSIAKPRARARAARPDAGTRLAAALAVRPQTIDSLMTAGWTAPQVAAGVAELLRRGRAVYVGRLPLEEAPTP